MFLAGFRPDPPGSLRHTLDRRLGLLGKAGRAGKEREKWSIEADFQEGAGVPEKWVQWVRPTKTNWPYQQF